MATKSTTIKPEDIEESISLHKRLTDVLKEQFDLTSSGVDIVDKLNSLQKSIVNALKKENELRGKTFDITTNIEKKYSAIALEIEKSKVSGLTPAITNRISKLTKEIIEEQRKLNKLKDESLEAESEKTMVVELFNQIDESAAKFRREMGFTRQYTSDIDKYARTTAVNFAKVGVTGEQAYEAASGLSKQLFSSTNVSEEMLSNTALISAQLGVASQVTSELTKNLAMVSRNTASSQQNTVLFAAALSEAAGTSLNDVMSDINTATKSQYIYISRSGTEMVKAAVEAKRMGTTIQSAAESSLKLLSFTQNVRDEMEASVLLGKSINLQKARELSYNRDIRGLNAEILKIIHDTNFEQLDPFQQAAVAAALGKSAGELAQIAQAERERGNIVKAMTPEQKTQYDLYNKMLKGGEQQKKNYAEIAKSQLMQMGNQSRMNTIAQSWHSIMMQLADKLLPVIDVLLKFIADNLHIIVSVSSAFFGWTIGISKSLQGAGKIIKEIGTEVRRLHSAFKGVFGFIGSFFKWLGPRISLFGKWMVAAGKAINTWLKPVRSVFAWFGRIIGVLTPLANFGMFFGKWLNPIGWVITAIMFLTSLFKRLSGILDVYREKGFWAAIGHGIKAVFGALWDVLIQPFIDLYNWIMKHLGAKSPSEIGLAILQGIKAVGDMITYALFSPFIRAWNLIKKIPFVEGIFGGKNIGSNITPNVKAAMDVERPKPEIDAKKTSDALSTTINSINDGLAKKMDAVIGAINALRDDMKNGTLMATVYLDSQKLDAAMSRRIEYTGRLM